MITRVHIRRYKSLADVEVHLQPLSVLFGPNAAGKSNFLDALQLLSAMVAPGRPLHDAFKPPYRGQPLESFAFAPGGVAELLDKESATFEIEVDLELSEHTVAAVNRQIADLRHAVSGSPDDPKRSADPVRERHLRYRVEVEILPRRGGVLRVRDEYLAALDGSGKPTRQFIHGEDDRLVTRMEVPGRDPRFDLDSLDHTLLSRPLYAPHYPHAVAAQRELASWSFFYFEPRERMRQPNPIKEVRQLGSMGEDLAAYLNTLRAENGAQFESIQRALRMLIPSIDRIEVEQTNRGEVELYLVEEGVPVPARVVSEGTLRVVGLLALAAGNNPVPLIGFEEPENGIHPRRVALIADVLKSITRSQTQLIVTTHSPELIDRVPPESLYEVSKRRGVTSVVPGTDTPLFKRQLAAAALNNDGSNDDLYESIGDLVLRGGSDD
jgi:predicted ATPase